MRTANFQKLLLLFFLMLLPTTLLASEIEEVIVTATKRGDTDIQSIAGGIHAIGGADMEAKGILDFEQFSASVPGLNFQDLGPGDKEYIIRGINGNGPAVVGAYFDEYVITANDQQDGGGKNAPIKLVDLQRVEVLNGPQGTLYGANSMAGTIKFIPRKPDTGAFDAYADSDFSDTKNGGFNYSLTAVINVPVVKDRLALRLVGWRTDNNGWIDQPRLQTGPYVFDGNAHNINDEETNGGRFMLRWTPNEDITIDALALHQDMDVGGSSRFTGKGTIAWPGQPPEIANLPGNPGFANLPGLAPLTPDRNFENADITVNPRSDDVDLFGITGEFRTDYGAFNLSVSRFKHDIEFVFDSTPVLLFFGVPIPGITVQPQSYETKMFEGRFASSFDGPFNIVAGVYYQKDENDFEVQVTTTDDHGHKVPWDPLNSNDALSAGGTAFFGRIRSDEIEQKAVFGEATLQLAEKWTLLGGLRWFKADVVSDQATTHGFVGAISVPEGEIIGSTFNGNPIGRLRQSGDTVRPKFSLSYQAADDVMVYALYSEGFRVGGTNNANQPFAPGIPGTYDSDELKNTEFGIKSRWLDDRLQVNASAFFIDWNDIQVEPRDPAAVEPFTTNGGGAKVNGLEWAVEFLPTDSLRFDFNGAYYFDHQLTEDQPPLIAASPFVITGLKGDKIPNVPELQLFGSAKYSTEVGGMPFSVTADVTYRDSTDTEFRADNPFSIHLPSYVVVDLFANLDINRHFSLGAYIRNLNDELAVYDGIGTFQDPESLVAARPRTYGVTLKWRY